LRTPLAGEDRNPTLQARQYYGDGESSYGYGMSNNGLDDQSDVSAMTAALRQAVSRSKFDGSPHPSSRSRASSTAGSSGRNSITQRPEVDDLTMLRSLSLGDDNGRRSFDSSEEGGYVSDEGTPFDPSGLVFLRRLGEGTGGSVDLVQDPRTGRVMAKKVCKRQWTVVEHGSFQVIARTTNPAVHKQLLRELKFLDACTSPYIVAHYGSFLVEKDSQIGILMEYCEGGSLDSLVSKMKKRNMWCSEHVLGRIASSVSFVDGRKYNQLMTGTAGSRLPAQTQDRSPGYQAVQYPAHARWVDQAVRLWGQRRDDRLDRGDVHGYQLLYGGEFTRPVLVIPANASLNGSRAAHTLSKPTSGLSV